VDGGLPADSHIYPEIQLDPIIDLTEPAIRWSMKEFRHVPSPPSLLGAIPLDGSAIVLLGGYGDAKSALRTPSPVNYFSVRLKEGESWRYVPPANHTVAWAALSIGSVAIPDPIYAGELVAFTPSNQPIGFHALADAEFVLGSAVPHPHELVLGYYSVHTSPQTLIAGERRIDEIRARPQKEGRL
jgi:hypothetical protein